MGRYTTVQAYADNNPNMRAVDYSTATGTAAASSGTASAPAAANRGPVVSEKVDNPYGSTAGAGSGEFHVYRHARAREMERWKKINEDEAEMKAEEEFRTKLAEDTKREEDKTEKRRRKRERAKEAKRRKKNMKLGGVGGDIANEEQGDDEDDEFEYTPIAAAASEVSQGPLKSDDNDGRSDNATEGLPTNENAASLPEENGKVPPPPFANDGSFLEQMKKELSANAE